MSTKAKDPKGYGDFSSGIDRNALTAFINNYTPKNNTTKVIIVVVVAIAVIITFTVFN